MTNLFLKHRVPLLCILLGAVTFAVYLPVRNHEFVRYDDDIYVTENPNVRTGLTAQNVKWAFTTGHASNWHPLTWLSHMLDCTLFGQNAGAHHLINVAFHIANTLLLFIVFNRMTKRIWPSAFVAALFALHPLHVESVAWVAERKDVLSTLFWLLTMLAYVRYAEGPSAVRYLIALIFFTLGLMAKPMLVTLPSVLILLDYWPLSRLNSKFSILSSIIEKLPFFILTITSSIITYVVQQQGGSVSSIYALPIKIRTANAICSYLAYIEKSFYPIRLAVLYPHFIKSESVGKISLFAIILILITIIAIYRYRCFKYLLVGWLWYLGTLVPVIGIVQVGVHSMADRYTYIPLIGLFAIVAFAAVDLAPKIPFRKIPLPTLAAVVLTACTIATSIQLKYWKNTFSLFEHALAVTKNNYIIHDLYACLLNKEGRPAEAVKHFTEALKFVPDAAYVHNNLGNALLQLDRIDEAAEECKIALKLDPKLALARYNLARALGKKGDYNGAIEHYRIYLDMAVDKQDFAGALSDLGFVLSMKGDANQAVAHYYQSLQLDPNDSITRGRLALILVNLGRIDESISQCRIYLKFNPDDAEMHNILGVLLKSKGRYNEAIECFNKALLIDPNLAKARDNLNALLQEQIQPSQ